MTLFRHAALRCAATAAAAFLALVTLPAEAQWKWRDPSGRIQYSDLPPPASTPEKDILARPAVQQRAGTPQAAASAASAASAAPAGASPLAPRTADPDLEAKRKKADGEQADKAKAEQDRIAAARADNCARARSQLSTLESGIRLARTNEKGEREFLDDQQRAAETKRMQDTIASDCR